MARSSSGVIALIIGDNMRFTHGLSRTSEYSAWRGIRRRCLNPKYKHFHYYGGRGIKVCRRWLKFENFIADVGRKPSKHHSIDRYPDNNGDYKPGNVRWATRRQQMANRRITRTVVYKGKTVSLIELCRRMKVDHGMIRSRLKYGWTIERAIRTKANWSRKK